MKIVLFLYQSILYYNVFKLHRMTVWAYVWSVWCESNTNQNCRAHFYVSRQLFIETYIFFADFTFKLLQANEIGLGIQTFKCAEVFFFCSHTVNEWFWYAWKHHVVYRVSTLAFMQMMQKNRIIHVHRTHTHIVKIK